MERTTALLGCAARLAPTSTFAADLETLRLWEGPQRPPPVVATQREPSIYDYGFFDGLVS
jgi:hypothetical protein